MPPLKGLLACLAVLAAGSAALMFVPMTLGLWGPEGQSIELALALSTLVTVVAVGRRTLGRPYLRRQVVAAAALGPVAVAALVVAIVVALDVAGAHCPRSGMDYISECNDLASASMTVTFVGVCALALSVVIAVGVLLAAGAARIRAARRTGGSAREAGGWR